MTTPTDLCFFIEGRVTYKPGYKLSARVDGANLTLNMVASGLPEATRKIHHTEEDTFSIRASYRRV